MSSKALENSGIVFTFKKQTNKQTNKRNGHMTMSWKRFNLMVWLATAFTTVSVTGSSDDNYETSCGLYLAVSSTSTAEDPKWGLYAGKGGIRPKTRIGYGEVAINTHEMEANAFNDDIDQDYLVSIVSFIENYIWVPHPVGGQNEVENGKVVTSISGGGMLSGFNAKMTNADWNHSVAYHRPDWNEKAEDSHPGRGAYSNFFEASIYATDEIPEGMEVFISYGENYEEEHATKEEEELSKEDMVKLDMTVDKMIDFFDKHKDELDEDSKAEVYEFLILDVMQAAAGTQKGKLIADMLPESPDELKQIKEQGGILDFSRPGMVRRLDWLEKHGMCMDNIRPGPSTIPHAGRGAFATRAFGEGGRIAPSPMLQIADEEVMLMYELKTEYDETEDEDYSVRYGESPVNTQLLLNYCFGHPESRMLLLPAGSGVSLINHSKKPNAKLVWSDHPSHHSHWLTLSPEELMEEGNRYLGLLMEVVAIKDIEEGDEIFIDYGSLWQAAWDKHVAEWEKGKGRKRILQKWPIRALDLNNQYSNKTFTPKAEYPENVEMRCFLIISKPPEGEPTTNENGDKIRHWKKHTHKESIDSSNLFDCSVSEVQEEKGEDGDYQYTIEWVSALSGATTIVKNVPHKAIVFQDKPNTSDHFTADAFRHYIELPDTVFPEGPWRDVEEE